MPIRFRCVYCDKLLGIATRKAGTVVNCPQCGQPLIVPSPEPQPAAAGAAATVQSPPSAPHAGNVFEQDDFDVVLAPDATVQAPPPLPPPRPQPVRTAPARAPLPQQPFALEKSLPSASYPAPTPIPIRAGQQQTGIVLTPIKLIVALVVVMFLLGLAFVGGFLVGRI